MKRYRVVLQDSERTYLQHQLAEGKFRGTKLRRAYILLGADEHQDGKQMNDAQIMLAYGGSAVTLYNTRRRFVEEGFERALHGKPRPVNRKRKLDGRAESHLLALRCSDPPAGESRWSLRLLADKMVELGYVASISTQGISDVLKKHPSSPGKSNRG
ncbi:MAG: helix-turn-helix domain-containing protein [Bacteroidota bacterium]